jgi:PAS domain S-box-containing protein
MNARRPAIIADVLPDLRQLPSYARLTEEASQAMAATVLGVHFSDLGAPESAVAWAMKSMEEAARRNARTGLPPWSMAEMIEATAHYKRVFLKHGIEAVEGRVEGASLSLQALIGKLDRFTQELARAHIKAEREQAHKLRQFQAMADNAIDGICMLDKAGLIAYVNAAGASIHGSTPEDMLGSPGHRFSDPDDLKAQLPSITEGVHRQGGWRGTLKVVRPSGEKRRIQTHTFLLPQEDAASLRLASIYRDITEAEADREKLQRLNEEKSALREQMIEAQQRALRELSSPLIPLARGVLAMPLIGGIDARRSAQIMEVSLHGIAAHKASRLLMDITGVTRADAQIADTLIRTARAARLLGAQVIITGIQPAIARTLVEIAADLEGITTYATIEEGIARVLR